MTFLRCLTLALFGLLALAGPVWAQPAPAVLAFDENGNGAFGPGSLRADPGPGGLPSVLTYSLPFAVVPGDVSMQDNGPPFVGINDIVRFNSPVGALGTLLFYSDNVPTADSLADTPTPPLAFYGNNVKVLELGPEGANSVAYTPLAGDPGFNANFPGQTYLLVSDGGRVPEPSSLALLGAGLAALASTAWRRHRRK